MSQKFRLYLKHLTPVSDQSFYQIYYFIFNFNLRKKCRKHEHDDMPKVQYHVTLSRMSAGNRQTANRRRIVTPKAWQSETRRDSSRTRVTTDAMAEKNKVNPASSARNPDQKAERRVSSYICTINLIYIYMIIYISY